MITILKIYRLKQTKTNKRTKLDAQGVSSTKVYVPSRLAYTFSSLLLLSLSLPALLNNQ